MKTLILELEKIFYLNFILALFLFSCREVPPTIALKRSSHDTTFVLSSGFSTPQNKNILIEDFTGMKCFNCVQAHEIISSIQNANPNRVVAVAIHPLGNGLAIPLPGALDFRTQVGADLYSTFVGTLQGLPAGAIDRIPTSSGFLNGNPGTWQNSVNNELLLNTVVNVSDSNSYDAVTNSVKIKVYTEFTQSVTDTLSLSICIKESGIVNPQETTDSNAAIITIPNYTHNNVLREYLTPYNGTLFDRNNFEKGRVFVKILSYTFPSDINPANCKVMAIIHRSGIRKEVLQVCENNVK